MQPIVSNNLSAVGYDADTRTMRVPFHSGGVYDYLDVAYPLFKQILLPHPWRRTGFHVKAHHYHRVAAA
ncbi:KTSC domain-containing protein [Nocardioides pantholopis]|uniref:KTSC domain-containing protein n=1 Tax=Nocardioides pantholopis TaxID=2483798 RepID=UPI0021E1A153|nr:KTSC domain-containing protein [Nocardioides pantholopis]